MNYEKLGEFIYMPRHTGKPLTGKEDVKFNYYLSSHVHGRKIDLDITTKLFSEDDIYIRKACYRVEIGQIEECVKQNLINHMLELGINYQDIPENLICRDFSPRGIKSWSKDAS